MPYKDLERKIEWERQNRPHRLARRRQLRRIEAAQKEARPEPSRGKGIESSILLSLAAGGALVVYSPQLAIGAGTTALLVAAVFKKTWSWWILGAAILIAGLFFQQIAERAKK
jgi:hypothetical protein